jgi:hypothetical protein
MQGGGAFVKAITRFFAPAGVAGGQTGFLGVCDTAAVAEGAGTLVLGRGAWLLAAAAFFFGFVGVDELERPNTSPKIAARTTRPIRLLRSVRFLRWRLSCSARFSSRKAR